MVKGSIMTQSDSTTTTGGSAKSARANRSAGKLALSVAFIAIAIGLVYQGVIYIGDGVGGLVPYLMIVLGPALAVYYIWYLLFRAPDESTE
jgi:hypothetical protein